MKTSLLTASVAVALAQMFAVGAFAQTKGEADPAQSKAAPSAPATKEQKAAAKTERKAEGAEQAKTGVKTDTPHSQGMAKAATKEEKAAAKAKRKAEASEAVKKGEISSGEAGTPKK